MKKVFAIFCLLVISIHLSYSQEQWNWKNANIQGMGYVTGIVIHPENPEMVYARTDVGGVFSFNRETRQWKAITDHFNVEERGVLYVESIALCDAEPSAVFIAVRGNNPPENNKGDVLSSYNGGRSWASTGLKEFSVYTNGNDLYRGTTGERLAADPVNPDRLFFGSRRDGLYMFSCESWKKIESESFPQSFADPGITFVVFDSKSIVQDEKVTQKIYIGIYNHGVFCSGDGGSTWNPINTTDKNPVRAHVTQKGALLVSFGGDENSSTGQVKKYEGETWFDITPFNENSRHYHAYSGIFADPQNPDILMVTRNNHNIYRSVDEGDNWAEIICEIEQPAYYPKSANQWGHSSLVIDPQNPKNVWQGTGYGVMVTHDITASPVKWNMEMNGLEELMVQDIAIPTRFSGYDFFSAVGDMVGFIHENKDVVPAKKVFDGFNWVAQATSVDVCHGNPDAMAWVGFDESNLHGNIINGISVDEGKSWKKLSNQFIGGSIVFSSKNSENLVWAPSLKEVPVYSKNGGRTWLKCSDITRSNISDPFFQKWNQWWNGEVLAADKVNGLKFYYFNNGCLFYSEDGGENWESGASDLPKYYIQTNLKTHPVKENEIWITFKPNDNMRIPEDCRKIFRSTDGGKSFGQIATVEYAYQIAFGKGNSPEQPFVYMHGRLAGSSFDGIYKSENEGETWQLISNPDENRFPGLTVLEADTRIKNLVYTGNSGRGIIYGLAGHPVTKILLYTATGDSVVEPGKTIQVFADVFPGEAENKEISWHAKNISGLGEIDENGLFTAISEGEVQVTATAQDDWGKSVSIMLHVARITGTEHWDKTGFACFPTQVRVGEPIWITIPSKQQGLIRVIDIQGKTVLNRIIHGTEIKNRISLKGSGIFKVCFISEAFSDSASVIVSR
ncbi:MAG: Ig-like domain-containing protein [Bacteroidales bacterium]|nr:Ig-like domain-containing protein [Bacteroidales bacterium]